MSELINFRDFGGYKTRDGRRVKKDTFYRGGSYRDLTPEDREYIQSLNIQHLFDYREEHELESDEMRSTFAKNVHNSSASAHLNNLHQGSDGEERKEDEVLVLSSENMKDFYRVLPFGNPGYKEMFDVLVQDENATPFLHNCTAGKDRTGVASALILIALGVHSKIAISDYMKSMNAYEQVYKNELRRNVGKVKEEGELIYRVPGLVVMPEYIETALDAILEKYGTYEKYFEEEYGMTQEILDTLRDRYTESV